jgi:hypothetical protein
VAPIYAGLWFTTLKFDFLADDDPALKYVLRCAEFYRHFGENYHPPIGRTGPTPASAPLLDPATNWRCPPHALANLPGIERRVFSAEYTGLKK